MESKNRKDKNLQEQIKKFLNKQNIDRQTLSNQTLEQVIEKFVIYLQEPDSINNELQEICTELAKLSVNYIDLFQEAPIGYVVLNDVFIIQSANKVFKKLTRNVGREIVGENITDFICPTSQDDFYRFIKDLSNSTKTRSIKVHLKSSSQLVLSQLDTNILNNGKEIYYRCAFTNISSEGHLAFNLQERIKEQNCLLNISKIISKNSLSLDQILQQVVEEIPKGFQFQDKVGAQILIMGKKYQSTNFSECAKGVIKRIPINLNNDEKGELAVCCCQAAHCDSKVFLSEEENMIKAVAIQIAQVVELRYANTLVELKEQYYRSLLNGLHEDILVIDSNHIIIDVNNSFLKTSGKRRDEVVGKHCYEVSYGLNQPCSEVGEKCELKKVFKTKKPSTCLHTHKHPDKDNVCMNIILSPIMDEYGKVTHVIESARDITDIIKTKRNLKESEEKFRLLVSQMQQGLALHEVVKDEKGLVIDYRFLEANKSFEKLTGLKSDDIIGERILQILPKIEKKWIKIYGKVATTGNPVHFEDYSSELDKYYRVDAYSPKPNQFAVIITDISDIKQTEKALITSNERYRNLFENSHAVMLVIDPQMGAIIDANPAAESFYGWNREEIKKMNINQINTLSDEEIKNEMALAVTEKRRYFKFKHKIKEGSIRDVEVFSGPVEIQGQTLLYSFIHDITEKLQAEKAIKISEAKYRRLAEATRTIFWEFNLKTNKWTYISPQVTELLGYPPDQWINYDSWATRIHPLDRKHTVELCNKSTNLGENHDMEYRFIKANGQTIWIREEVTVESREGQPEILRGIMMDITERKKAEENVILNAERLKALVRILEYKTEDIKTLLDFALHEAIFMTSSKFGFLHYYDESTQLFTLNSWSKDVMPNCEITDPQTCFELNKTGLWGEVVRQRKGIVVNDYQSYSAFNKGFPMGHIPIKRYLSIPVIVEEKIVAVIAVANKDNDYSENDINQLRLLMNSVWSLVQRKQDSEKISKLSAAVEQSSASVVITNKNGIIEYVNPKFTEITGHSFEEAVGKTPKILNSGYHNTQFFTNLWGTILSGNEWKGRLVNKKKSGELHWESAIISSIKNSKGEIINFIAIKDDITELKLAEDALRDSELKLRLMIDKSPDGIMLTDENGVIVTWNKAMENITRIEASNAIGLNIVNVHKLMANENASNHKQDMIDRVVMDILSTGKSSHFKAHGISEVKLSFDGDIHYVELMKFVIPVEKGNLLASFVRDITQQKQSDIAVKEREEKLQTIFDNSTQSLVMLSPDLCFQAFNKIATDRAKYFFGKEIEVGKSIFDIYPSSRLNKILHIKEKVLKGESTLVEFNIKDSARNLFWFELTFSPVFNSERKVVGIFFNSIDITQRKVAEESMANALEKERELNALRSRFVSTVSHEFRTPLASINSNTQLLQRYHSKWDSDKKNSCFTRVFESVNAMTSMLENVSLIGKEQSGKLTFHPQAINLNALALQIVEESHISLSEEKRVKLQFKGDFEKVMLDPVLLRHILVNILTNALKYSSGKQIVIFTIRQRKRFIEFIVQDFGVGIPSDEIEYVFEPFFRASNSEDFKGTGLGMSIAKQCVEIHRGEIFIESTVNQGTTISIQLPLREK